MSKKVNILLPERIQAVVCFGVQISGMGVSRNILRGDNVLKLTNCINQGCGPSFL